MNNKISKLDYFQNLGILLYFVILGIERLLAVIFGFANTQYNFFAGNAFSYYIHILTLISLVCAFAFINKQFIYMIKCAFSPNKERFEMLNYQKLAIGSGIILLGGMVHTNFTQLIVQFVSYGFLILSMIMVTVRVNKNSDKINRLKIWTDLAYAISFAMAIPVAYAIKNIEIKNFLEPFQCVASFMLVLIFTYFLYCFYKNNGKIKLTIPAFFVLLAFDLPIFLLRMQEEMNLFLVIFPTICLVIIIFYIISYNKSQKKL